MPHHPTCVALARRVLMLLGLVLQAAIPAGASIARLAEHAAPFTQPEINNSGWVVWESLSGDYGRDIYLWDGTRARPISGDGTWNAEPRLNGAGQAVWSSSRTGGLAMIDFWDGRMIRELGQISVPPGGHPEIDEWGQVVWWGGDGIAFWDGARARQLAPPFGPPFGGNGFYPRLTPAGLIAWFEGSSDETVIHFQQDDASLRISERASIPDRDVGINDAAEMAWASGGVPSALLLWNGSLVRKLDAATAAGPVAINDAGELAWGGQDGAVYLWDGTGIQRLSDPGGDSFVTQMNEAGQVVWVHRASVSSPIHVYLWTGFSVEPLSDDSANNTSPQVNDLGQVVWERTSGSSGEIYLYTPPVAAALAPSVVLGGKPTTGRVILDQAAPAGGAPVSLSSDDPRVVVPRQVTVPAGAASVTFPAMTHMVTEAADVIIRASFAGATRPARLRLLPAALSIRLHLSTVPGGNPSTATLTLAEPAPAGGAVIPLASDNPGVAAVPSQVTLPEGHTPTNFWVRTSPVTTAAAVTLSAAYGEAAWKGTLQVTPPGVSSLSLNPASLYGGGSATGTVVLNGPAPAGGTMVHLTSDNPAVTVPPDLTIAAGTDTGTFPITTAVVDQLVQASLSASAGSGRASASLTVAPMGVAALDITPPVIAGGRSATGTVRLLAPVPEVGAAVTIASDNSAAQVVLPVGFPFGATSAQFPVITAAVTRATTVTFSATQGRITRQATLTVLPDIVSLTFAPASVEGGNPAAGTLTLRGPAPAGGAEIALSSLLPEAASVPAQVTIPAGQTSVTFPITTSPVSGNMDVEIQASYAGQTWSSALPVLAAGVEAVFMERDSIVGGRALMGTVLLHHLAPAGGLTVALTSENPSLVTVPASVTVPAGQLYTTFSVMTRGVADPTVVHLSATYGGVAHSSDLTLLPVGLTAVTAPRTPLTGGEAAEGGVILEGPVVGRDAVVTLASTVPEALSVPSQVRVPVGQSGAVFSISTMPVSAPTFAEIVATYRGEIRTAMLLLQPHYLVFASLRPNPVIGGLPTALTITLSAPSPPYNILPLVLSSSDPAVVPVPAFTGVGDGATSATFLIATRPVIAETTVTLTATLGTGSASATLVLLPSPLADLTLNPSRLAGGDQATGTVSLDRPAPEGGAIVSLSSDHPAVAETTASVLIPAGKTSANFMIRTYPVVIATEVAITAEFSGTARTAKLTVLPAGS
jgi:hypothetical protein